MTTAIEAIAAQELAALRVKLATAERKLAEAAACNFRLNGTLVKCEAAIDALTAENAQLTAALDRARAGLLELPY